MKEAQKYIKEHKIKVTGVVLHWETKEDEKEDDNVMLLRSVFNKNEQRHEDYSIKNDILI